jgi:hypothetical protein
MVCSMDTPNSRRSREPSGGGRLIAPIITVVNSATALWTVGLISSFLYVGFINYFLLQNVKDEL